MKKLRSISRKYYLKQIVCCWMIFSMAFVMPVKVAMANPNPTPGTLPSGIINSSGIDTPVINGLQMDINQTGGEAIINWNNFDIGAGAGVEFFQPSSYSAVLNRVHDGDMTGIMGNLTANGRVFIVNPAGIVLGGGATVNVAQLVASGLNMSNSAFHKAVIGQKMAFAGGHGDVKNYGTINADSSVYLIGEDVLNNGDIICPGGMVVMAAADRVRLGQPGSPVIVEVGNLDADHRNDLRNNGTINTGKVVLAAGDVWSQAAINGVDDLSVVAMRNVKIDGDIAITGDAKILAGQNKGAAGLRINADITAARMKIKNGRTFAYEATHSWIDVADGARLTSTDGDIRIEAVHDVILGNGKDGIVIDAEGDLYINADKQGKGKHGYGGDLVANAKIMAGGSVDLLGNAIYLGDVRAKGGDLNITARTTRDRHIRWGGPDGKGSGITPKSGWGNIEVEAWKKLYAKGNINIIDAQSGKADCAAGQLTLTGHRKLSLVADEGTITSDAAIGVTGSTLFMDQFTDLDTADYTFFNQANTDLTLKSDGGSVTSTTGDNKASAWNSIGAKADQDITLAGSRIKLGKSVDAGESLRAVNGSVKVTGFNVMNSPVNPTGSVNAGTDVKIRVVHGINLGGDVTSDNGDIRLLADTDTRYGHDVVVAGNINSGGILRIEGANVDIQSAQSAGNMDIYAHGLYDKGASPEPLIASGDVVVHGTLSTTDGHIQIEATDFGPGGATTGPTFASPGDTAYSADGKIYLHGNVTANGTDSGDDVILRSNTVASDGVVITAYDDIHVGGADAGSETAYPDVTTYEAKNLTGLGDITMVAGQSGAPEVGNVVIGGSVKTKGNLDMTAERILVAGDVDATVGTGGSVKMTVTDDMLSAPGVADNNVDIGGDVKAAKSVEIDSTDHVMIDGSVSSENSHITILANTDNMRRGGIEIGGKVTTSNAANGDITIKILPNNTSNPNGADDDIRLHDDVDSAKSLTVIAQQGSVRANQSLTSKTDMYLQSVDYDVNVDGFVDSGATLQAKAGVDVILQSSVESAGDMSMNAGNNIRLNEDSQDQTMSGGSMTLIAGERNANGDIEAWGTLRTTNSSNGDLVAKAADDIDLNKTPTSADSAGKLQLLANQSSGNGELTIDGDIYGNMTLYGYSVTEYGNVTSYGTLDVDADTDITLRRNVSSVDEMTMDAGDNIKLNQDSGMTTSQSDITLLANRNEDATVDVVETGSISADGFVKIEGEGIDVTGNVTAGDFVEMTVIDDMEVGNIINTAHVSGSVTANNKIDIKSGDNVDIGASVTSNTKNINIQANTDNLRAGYIEIGGKVTTLSTTDGDINIEILPNGNPAGIADGDVMLHDDVDSAKTLTVIAQQGDVLADKSLTSKAAMLLKSVDGSVIVDGFVDSGSTLQAQAGVDVILKSSVESADNMSMNAGNDISLNQDSQDHTMSGGSMTLIAGERDPDGDIKAWGTLKTTNTSNGDLTAMATDNIDLYKVPASAEAVGKLTLSADSDKTWDGHVHAHGTITTTNNSDIDIEGQKVTLRGNVDSAKDLTITAREDNPGENFHHNHSHVSVLDGATLKSANDMTVTADDHIILTGGSLGTDSATSGGNMVLRANADHTDGFGLGDVVADGDLTSGGSIDIYSSDNTTYLGGNVDAATYVHMHNNTKFTNIDDQFVDAGTSIRADEYLEKLNPESTGSLYLMANDDIVLGDGVGNDYVKVAEPGCYAGFGGGVAIVSKNGSIYTDDGSGTLNVPIFGRSDHWNNVGVYNVDAHGRYYDGEDKVARAAIAIVSADELKIGNSAELRASGRYYDDVDDRSAINFLDEPRNIPVGGPLRDPGVASDIAIFVRSFNGDVTVDAATSILSSESPIDQGYKMFDDCDYRPECVNKGAMVIDGKTKVILGDTFRDSLKNGDVGDRLEVCSRDTEWLYQAVGRLPMDLELPSGYNYVMRGAGGDNPDIEDGEPAWVLEDPDGTAAPLTQFKTPRIEGCPAKMQAVAKELGIAPDTIQVAMGNALALNPTIQPCDACASIIDAAAILRDEDGSRMAAMIQMFNEQASPDAPFTPEMETSIAMAFKDVSEGSQYASAMEYVDAFVQYVATLDELGSPVGDSLAFVMNKYGEGVSENGNIAEFVVSRIASLETYGG